MISQKTWGIALLVIVLLIMGALFYMGFTMGVNSVTQDYLKDVCQYVLQLKWSSPYG